MEGIEATSTVALPPSVEEQRGYYYGLPSRPKLVARSSSAPWEPQADFFPIGKKLAVVANHPIVNAWNESDGPLRRDVLQALRDIQWTAIDILKIGYERIPYHEDDSIEPDMPVTLFVSVKPGTTSWQEGYATVMLCRNILQRHGIFDVHCEMKEAVVVQCVTPAVAPLNTPLLFPGPLDHDSHVVLSEYIGVSIATEDCPQRAGTKCIYLREKNTGNILALTCRHVVFNPDIYANADYQDDAIKEPQRKVIQPGLSRFDEDLKAAARAVMYCDQALKQSQSSLKLSDEEKAAKAVKTHALRQPCQAWLDRLETFKDPGSRVIGHVNYSPAFGMAATASGEKQLRDWALIELNPAQHQSALSQLVNEAVIGLSGWDKLMQAAERFSGGVSQVVFDHDRQSVPLKGTIPEAEMRHPLTVDPCDEPGILVAKYGAKTSLTIGVANPIKSVVKRIISESMPGTIFHSEEWCIVGWRQKSQSLKKTFSDGGDSGSCIWDMSGRIGGMLTGGLTGGDGGAIDTTYATPMDWLMNDITESGMDVEIV